MFFCNIYKKMSVHYNNIFVNSEDKKELKSELSKLGFNFQL